MKTTANKKFQYFAAFAAMAFIVVLSSPITAFAASVNTADKAELNKTIVYMVTTVIAFVLLVSYSALAKKKESVLSYLFVAVFVINLGYAFGSASTTLQEALLANKISYAGAVFLPLFMLLIIMDECRVKRNKIIVSVLMCISGAIFLLTMTPGYTTWYYESIELVFVNGGAKLVKTYGPLHNLYLWYLVLYFGAMIAVLVWSVIKRKSATRRIPLILLALVFGNIFIWYIEQRVNLNFEFLSISYLITEVWMLFLYNTVYQPEEIVHHRTDEPYGVHGGDETNIYTENFDSGVIPDMQDIIKAWPEVALLTTREIEVFKEIIINKKRKDIAEDLCVSENTVKKHTTNIFTKLGVSSRVEILNMLLKIK